MGERSWFANWKNLAIPRGLQLPLATVFASFGVDRSIGMVIASTTSEVSCIRHQKKSDAEQRT